MMAITPTTSYDVIIIGAGAAGLMCAIEAGKRGRSVLVIDHAKKVAEKIRISGGGRCNFTNIHTTPNHFISQNPHFCKSALSRYTPNDFIAFIERHDIAYHEKKLGQLFCDHSAQNIIDALLAECTQYGVQITLQTSISLIKQATDGSFNLSSSQGEYDCQSLVIATGGLSIPKIGASPFGYDIAKQFGHHIVATRAGLVPLTFQDDILHLCQSLSGISLEANISNNHAAFAEGLLFTHRGLSGPSVLQMSSYWQNGESLSVNLCPTDAVFDLLKHHKQVHPKQDVQTILAMILPKRLAVSLCDYHGLSGRLADLSHDSLQKIADCIHDWRVIPNGTEGYRTAEVTLGGVDTDDISSKTMESKKVVGLYFIGEVLDVTGHLGGFNFQWAWSSGFCAGQYC